MELIGSGITSCFGVAISDYNGTVSQNSYGGPITLSNYINDGFVLTKFCTFNYKYTAFLWVYLVDKESILYIINGTQSIKTDNYFSTSENQEFITNNLNLYTITFSSNITK